MTPTALNIADICPSTTALGPGNRFAIWVQGCPFTCAGCVAKAWVPFTKATVLPVEKLAEAVINTNNIQGITLSGGEPMMQAGRLALLVRLIKAERPGLDVILFSGFTRRQLIWQEARALLSVTDLLIDGQYIGARNDGQGLRGSNNQQFHFLTDRLLPYRETIMHQRQKIEFHILNDGVLMAGIPPANFTW